MIKELLLLFLLFICKCISITLNATIRFMRSCIKEAEIHDGVIKMLKEHKGSWE
jgi:hypothetical protein